MVNNTNYNVLKEIKELAETELNINESIGYTMPDGKHHIFIYVDDCDDEKGYVIEPNEVVDGAHEPMGNTTCANYNDFAGILVGVMWCIDYFFNYES